MGEWDATGDSDSVTALAEKLKAGSVLSVAECAESAVRDCGGLRPAIQWARRWAHRPYYARVAEHLETELERRGPSYAGK